ncbi:hypothetical protein HDU79_009850 [Rhizoclosmatium sp. JEL0117]|nr:hypothetical protein HDU79_009850 [Rhizoclosmatium sp. JEL0117]
MFLALEVQSPWAQMKIWMLETRQGTVGTSALGDTVRLTDNIRITGSFVVSECIKYETLEQWDADEHQHRVPRDSPYRWNGDIDVYGWIVAEPVIESLTLDTPHNDLVLERLYRSLFTLSLVVPTVDISVLSDAVLALIKTQCEHVGFLRVTHGSIDSSIVAAAHSAAKAFFSLPDADKESASKYKVKKTNDSFCSTGYRGAENGANNTGGRESWSCTRPDYTGTNTDPYYTSTTGRKKFSVAPDPQVPWPATLPHFQPSIENYYNLVQDLSTHLFKAFTQILNLPNESTLLNMCRRHTSTLMLSNHRPGYTSQAVLTPHADITCFTILTHDDSVDASGTDCLQVVNPYYDTDPRLGVWIPLARAPKSNKACFLVNIGQIMERWSAGSLKATLHRVVRNSGAVPRPVESRRQALVYFQNTDYDAVLEPLVQTSVGVRFEKEQMAEYEAKRMAALYNGSDQVTLFKCYNQDVLYRVQNLQLLD